MPQTINIPRDSTLQAMSDKMNTLISVLGKEQINEHKDMLDATDNITYQESGGNVITAHDNNISIVWDNSTAMGLTIVFKNPISPDVQKIRASGSAGTSYTTGNPVFYNAFGVRADYSPYVFYGYTTDGWVKVNGCDTPNSTFDVELDLSDVLTTTYLYIAGGGWNIAYNNIELVYDDGTIEILPIYDILSEINESIKEIASAIRSNNQ